MKLRYFPDTDTLYINLSDIKPANTDAITDNLIVDFDVNEQVVGITLEHASQTIDLSSVETINLPETVIHAS